jgi:hypothetical protein
MMRDLKLSAPHPAGEQSPVEDKGVPPGVNLDGFAGPVLVEWDAGWALTALGQLPFFVDFPRNRGSVRRFHRGLPVALHKRERAGESRRVWYGDAVDSVRAQTIRAYRSPAR